MPGKVDHNKTWQWLSKGDLKIGTEALCVTQKQAIMAHRSTISIRPVKAPCADYMGEKVEVCNT